MSDHETMHRAHFQIKAASGRRFTGLASTWDLDDGGDMILRGAYARTLAEWKSSGRIIPLIDQHNYGSVKSVVGRLVDAEETESGLETTFEIIGGSEGEPYAQRVKDGVIDGLSIGYRPRSARPPTDEEKRLGVRRVIEDISLKEVSLVIWGMNPNALITAVKANLAQMPKGDLRGMAGYIGELLRPEPKAREDEPPPPPVTEGIAPDDPKRAAMLALLRKLEGHAAP
jgi:HK97 family phage prohead protease